MAVSIELQREIPNLSADVIKRAETVQRRQLYPPIVEQARHYIQIAGLDPDKETLLLNGYGMLREQRFPVSAGQEEAARMIYSLYDQELFAFVLLITGRHTEFDRFTREFPNIFDEKQRG